LVLVRSGREHVDDSEAEIRREVRRMLEACGIDEPPTPLDRLLEYRRLTSEQRTEITPGVLGRVSRFFKRMGSKIRGLLDTEARLIVVDPFLHPSRQIFLRHHEVAHDVLPWHRDALVYTSEWDLLPSVRTAFEAEANRFAGHAIFQVDHMAHAYRGRRLKITELAGVAAQYGASLSATARQYILIQDIPAALVIGRPAGQLGSREIVLRLALANDAFVRRFGTTIFGSHFETNHPLTAVVNTPSLTLLDMEMTVTDANGAAIQVITDTVFTGYETLTLVHPVRTRGRILARIKSTRTRLLRG
jgi:Zn-dependent peptidase ImmA (M78 family)